MKRTSPLFSLPGLAFSLIVLIGLALSAWQQGGEAFSPGPMSTQAQVGILLKGYHSHVDFETQCNLCHQPLQTIQETLCDDCHNDIATQIASHTGLHGAIQNVDSCSTCHSEHHGRDFNQTHSAAAHFNHSVTHFSLLHHQDNYDTTPMDCSTCHLDDQNYTMSQKACADCHTQHKPDFMTQHLTDMGPRCLDCHDGVDRMRSFDHATSGFALEGKHAQATCAACHITPPFPEGRFKGTPKDCADCHAEPAAHLGVFDRNCATCHTSQSWSPVTLDGSPFAHLDQTRFSLARHTLGYDKQPLTCTSCHGTDLKHFDVQICADCHAKQDAAFVTKHIDKYSPACLDCHDGVDKMHNFKHETLFVLDGKHATIQCTDCHKGKQFATTPTRCVECHAEPVIHAGSFGLDCQTCHSATAWRPAFLKEHAFPLDHGKAGTSCQTCHTSSYAQYTCYGCHDHKEVDITTSHLNNGISRNDIPNCVKCHLTGKKENK